MVSYSLVWKRSAEKELAKLPKEAVLRLLALAESLPNNPYPPASRKLTGAEHTYRIRAGNYRLIYTVEAGQLVVEVIRVGHRKDVYR